MLLLAALMLLSGCSELRRDAGDYPGYRPSGAYDRGHRPHVAHRAPRPRAAKGAIRVRKGDTVYAISRRYGVAPREIITVNRLRPPYHLKAGQSLRLPRPRTHIVRKGETGYAISRRYGVDLTSLMRINRIRPPYTLKVGQRLRLPPQVRPPAPAREVAAKKTPPRKAKRKTPPVPQPVARGPVRFAWPVSGRVISRFGPKKGGLHNDGINIRVEAGAPVRAAEAGVVAYAGNQLKGFGNLLLIRHAGGWMTAYAHNRTIVVKEGARVRRGQIVARAGATGSVKTPQLHFEIRKGTTAVDPLRYLPRLEVSLAPRPAGG